MVHGVISGVSVPDIRYVTGHAAHSKLSFPVAPSSLIYSYLKHVSGVPAPEGSRGVTINRLNILDVLIAQMKRVRTNSSSGFSVSPEKTDALIDSLSIAIQQAAVRGASRPYARIPSGEAGQVFHFSM